jgi:hypothetical protein
MVYSLLTRSIHGTATGATDMGMVQKDEGLQFWLHLKKHNEQTETMSDIILLKRNFFQMAQKELITAFVQRTERARHILVKNKEIVSDNDAKWTLRDGFIDPGGCKQALNWYTL